MAVQLPPGTTLVSANQNSGPASHSQPDGDPLFYDTCGLPSGRAPNGPGGLIFSTPLLS
jgi:hypothetical protein